MIRLLIKLVPWILVMILGVWVYASYRYNEPVQSIVNRSAMLQKIEELGKLELVKYNFKEITEVQELSKEYFRLFKLGPDPKIALISEGEAVGCIDLRKISESDIQLENEILYIKLPPPEICYFKLDMENTRIYYLQTNPLKDEKVFIQKAYKHAEREIRQAAINSGILEQTRANAELILKPLLESMSQRKVVLIDQQEEKIEFNLFEPQQ